MYLITMAHYGEALSVIEKFKLKKSSANLFTNEEMVLIITGEGPFEAATKTALVIPQFKFKQVINIGIAGTLTEKLKVGDIVSVRTIYLVHEGKPLFKTFQGEENGIDCLTSFERILRPDQAMPLKGIGQLIDREAWGVAMAAKTGGLPFKSYKIISDMAGTIEACELVKEKAEELSLLIANKLMKVLKSHEEEIKHFELPGFHFTFSTQHQFKTLLNKLAIKHEVPEEEILRSLNLQNFHALNILPKERTKKLLEAMEEKIDPTKKVIEAQLRRTVDAFAREGLKFQFDRELENPKVTISMEVANDQELASKRKSLESLSIETFYRIMKGEFDVE